MVLEMLPVWQKRAVVMLSTHSLFLAIFVLALLLSLGILDRFAALQGSSAGSSGDLWGAWMFHGVLDVPRLFGRSADVPLTPGQVRGPIRVSGVRFKAQPRTLPAQ